MKKLPVNPVRGLIGFAAIVLMTVGAGTTWGWGAALFAFGLFVAIDAAADEAVERFTETTRSISPDD